MICRKGRVPTAGGLASRIALLQSISPLAYVGYYLAPAAIGAVTGYVLDKLIYGFGEAHRFDAPPHF